MSKPVTRLRSNTEKQTISQSLSKSRNETSSVTMGSKRLELAGLNKTPTRTTGVASDTHHQATKKAAEKGQSSETNSELQQLRTAWAAVSEESDAVVKRAVAANQKLIDQVAARRRRTDELAAIFKSEIIQLETETAAAEARTKELEQKRKELSDAARKVELEAYQHRRRASVAAEKDALVQRQLNTSRTSAQSARTLTGMYRQASDKPVDDVQAARNDFDEFARRAAAARELAQELQKESDENEAALSRKGKERQALVNAIDELQQAVAQLERNELVVEDAVRHTHNLLRSAGATHHEIPALQRAIRGNDSRLAELKAERENLVSVLMRLVEKDDEKIRQLQMMSLRSAGTTVMPTVIKDLTAENEAFQKMCFQLIEDAEKERVRLEGAAAAVAEKLAFVESKIKLKVPSAARNM